MYSEDAFTSLAELLLNLSIRIANKYVFSRRWDIKFHNKETPKQFY